MSPLAMAVLYSRRGGAMPVDCVVGPTEFRMCLLIWSSVPERMTYMGVSWEMQVAVNCAGVMRRWIGLVNELLALRCGDWAPGWAPAVAGKIRAARSRIVVIVFIVWALFFLA